MLIKHIKLGFLLGYIIFIFCEIKFCYAVTCITEQDNFFCDNDAFFPKYMNQVTFTYARVRLPFAAFSML